MLTPPRTYVFCYRVRVCARTPAVLRYDVISIRRGQPEKDEVAEEKPHRFYRSQHLFPLFTPSFISLSTCSLFSHYCHYWWNSSSLLLKLLLAKKIKEKKSKLIPPCASLAFKAYIIGNLLEGCRLTQHRLYVLTGTGPWGAPWAELDDSVNEWHERKHMCCGPLWPTHAESPPKAFSRVLRGKFLKNALAWWLTATRGRFLFASG